MTEQSENPQVYYPRHGSIDARYTQMTFARGYRFVVSLGWESLAEYTPPGIEMGEENGSNTKEWIFSPEAGVLVHMSRSIARVRLTVSATNASLARKVADDIKAALPTIEPPDEGRIDVRFWYDTQHGPTNVRRKLAAPPWDSIRHNYATEAATGLERLMTDFRPSHGGQIILWHGQPGTGKTYALRALVHAWKKWCDADFIVDPERLFGSDAAYLMSLLLDGYDADDDDENDPDDIPTKKPKGWKLLIMEDTGEMTSENAKDRVGQGLSRLLNVADGFIGQGLKVLILITTNEEMDKLHPAVSRPGRCAANINFATLDADAITAWARVNEVDRSLLPQASSLADLYSIVEGFDRTGDKVRKREVGFRAA